MATRAATARLDLRALKDQAARAVEKRQFAKAGDLYRQIAAAEPGEPDWRQRAGEALRKVPDAVGAIAELRQAVEGYAHGGFLLKAIAVCKVILQLDPRHTDAQRLLTQLYARKDGARVEAKKSGIAITAVPSFMSRTSTGTFVPIADSDVHAANAADMPRPTAKVPFRPNAPGQAVPLASLATPPAAVGSILAATAAPGFDDSDVLALDEITQAPALEHLELRALMESRSSAAFDLDRLMTEDRSPAAAYEISLDDDRSPDDADAYEPATSQTQTEPSLQALSDDWIPPVRRAPSLGSIPLLSSLGPEELQQLIERVNLREVDKGDFIVREGARGGSLFIVVSGWVEVVVGKPARRLAELGEGSFFGELALLTDSPRSATVRATAPTQLLEISRALVRDLVERKPEVLKTLLRFFRERMVDRLLGSSPLFASFSPDEARRIASRFVLLELSPQVPLIRAGEQAPGLSLLMCGEAAVVRDGQELARLKPGDVCGEMSLLTRDPASATIETRSKCWVLQLPRDRAQELLLAHPQMLGYVSQLAEQRSQYNSLHSAFL